LAPDGSVLDPGGVPLVTLPGDQHFAALAWTGASYLLAWENWPNHDVAATYVSPAGTILYPDGFPVSSSGSTPALASLGSTSLVAYYDTSSRVAARTIEPDSCENDDDCSAGLLSCLVAACIGHVCAHRIAPTACFIDGVCVAQGVTDPSDACAACVPASSQVGFSVVADGASCAGGTCLSGVCVPPVDGGSPDAEPADAAVSDASPDAPRGDAGTLDAHKADAPVVDAQHPQPDSGPIRAGEPDSGCGCDLTGRDTAHSPVLIFGLVALFLIARGRRRRGANDE
jgi:MYXO-CTERM domain-containing protein